MTVLFYTHVISYFYITGPRQYKKIMSKWRFKYCFFCICFIFFVQNFKFSTKLSGIFVKQICNIYY